MKLKGDEQAIAISLKVLKSRECFGLENFVNLAVFCSVAR